MKRIWTLLRFRRMPGASGPWSVARETQELERWLDSWAPPRDLQAEARILASLRRLPAQRRPSWWRRTLPEQDGLPGGWFSGSWPGAAPAAATLAILGIGIVFANVQEAGIGSRYDEVGDLDISALVLGPGPTVGVGQ